MASIVESVRSRFDVSDNQAREALQIWQSHHIFPPHDPLHEFCLQTAFMQFVHAYLLRICEEYALIPPFPAGDAQSKSWLDNSMKMVLQLLNYLDNSALANFAHVFDWFAPLSFQVKDQDTVGTRFIASALDRHFHGTDAIHRVPTGSPRDGKSWFTSDEQNVLQLYQLLKQYQFKTLGADILGKVYNEGFIEQRNRSEKGQFYTPPHIVNYMLDTLEFPQLLANDDPLAYGYTKYRDYLPKTIADLSCGTGSFLVAVAARKQAILQQLIAAGEITSDEALRILTGTLSGFDLNPFACYLATINLLIQCLPFLIAREENADKAGEECKPLPLQFSIHCIDALDAQAMEQAGFVQPSFDFLVGNPPYVSANESASNLLYRNKIWSSGQYRLLNQKWDLFVPFFERNLQLLQPESGRLGLIVSSGIETEGYAQRLREELCQHYSLLQIDFFPGLRVFPRTGIESTIVCAENRLPDETHVVRRRRHLRANLTAFQTLPSVRQLAETEQIFRWRYQPALSTDASIPLCAIGYIGTGIEAQSSEHLEEIIDGQRHKRFTLYDVFILPVQNSERPDGFSDDGVVGNDVDTYYLRRIRYVAYERYRHDMRGPRHPALFRTPEKLLLGETSGGYYDTYQLFTNHSVQVIVPWHALTQNGAIQETGIARVLRKSQQISGMTELASISQQFDLRYILAILNSRFMRRYLTANMHQGTRKGRIYPDIWKRLPIKMVPIERQKEIALLVEAVQKEYKKLVEPGNVQSKGILMKVNVLVDEIEKFIEAIYGK